MKKVRIIAIFTLIMALAALPAQAFAQSASLISAKAGINYVALGDSLAYGVDSNNKLGNGYPDFIAQSLQELQLLNTFNKGFSYPGYKTADVLKDLTNNVTKPTAGLSNSETTAQLHQAIANAHLITISVGANDVLPYISLDAATGTPKIDLLSLPAAFQEMSANYVQIMTSISSINPNAQIYVMGYYNSFAHYPAEFQPQIEQLLTSLNQAIQAGLKDTKAVFVETGAIISTDIAKFLPNPANVHLSEDGYKAVAAAFSKQILANNPEWTGAAPADDAEDTKEEDQAPLFSDIQSHWAADFIKQAVAAGIVNGYPDGTFKPEQTLTRVEATSLLVRSLGLQASSPAPFTDISQLGKSIQAEIAAAYQYGIVKGNNGVFSPNEPISRAHLALMVKRAYEAITGQPFTPLAAAPFADISSLDEETQTAISLLYTFGIVNGIDGSFLPNDPTTRAQAAKIFASYALLLKPAA